MAKRQTNVVLRLTWDDNLTDPPAKWDYKTLLRGDPFSREGADEVRLISVVEVDDGAETQDSV